MSFECKEISSACLIDGNSMDSKFIWTNIKKGIDTISVCFYVCTCMGEKEKEQTYSDP